MKPWDPNDAEEAAVIQFFKDKKPGWVVERPAPSIERVSCYVLDGGSVHVTEYQGRSIEVYLPVTGAFGTYINHATILQALEALSNKENEVSRIRVFPGVGESFGNPMRNTMVELPFTELMPSVSGVTLTVEKSCEQLLDQLNSHQRDVAIAIICAKYGNVERPR